MPHPRPHPIALHKLAATLAATQVHEPDEVWDPDMLFTQVASELHCEKEKAEGVPEGGADSGINDPMPGPPGQ